MMHSRRRRRRRRGREEEFWVLRSLGRRWVVGNNRYIWYSERKKG